MTLITKKVSDAEGGIFEVGFNEQDGVLYPLNSALREGTVKQPFYRFADTVGDGSGVYDLNGDYSAGGLGLTIAKVQPSAGEVLRLERVIWFIRDTGSFKASGYGAVAGSLTNGIQVRVQNDGGTLVNLTSQEKIVTNGGIGTYCYDVDVKTWGSGDEMLLARWTFAKAGYPLRLIGDNNERFELVLNDDFSDLVHHAFHLQGYYE